MQYVVSTPTDAATARAELLKLWRRNFPREWDGWYDWLIDGNPFGSVSHWLVSTASGEVVGSTGLMPCEMQLGGRTVSAAQAIHINVNREHRSVLPALQLQRALTQSVSESQVPFVLGVTETAVAVMQRAGYRLVGNVERWVQPLRTEANLRRKLHREWLVRPLAAIADRALQLRAAATSRRLPCGWRAEFGEDFDARFDQLWQRSVSREKILLARHRAFLTWRFRQRPRSESRWLGLIDSQGDLRAYLVFDNERCQKHDVPYQAIHDVWGADERAMEIVLAEFVRWARSTPAAFVSMLFFGDTRVSNALSRTGFLLRPRDEVVLIYAHPELPEADRLRLSDREQWHLTEAEMHL
jgi:hypothetical protein